MSRLDKGEEEGDVASSGPSAGSSCARRAHGEVSPRGEKGRRRKKNHAVKKKKKTEGVRWGWARVDLG